MKLRADILIDSFNHTLDKWMDEVSRYDFITLCTKPSIRSWSIGQICRHLINETGFYILEIRTCTATNEHAFEEPSSAGKIMLLRNEFPDETLDGPATNSIIPQPASKEQLLSDLMKLKSEMNEAFLLMSAGSYKGKTKHPGLNYFSAEDWLQFAEMHFRHHFRQKKRIDDFLKTG